MEEEEAEEVGDGVFRKRQAPEKQCSVSQPATNLTERGFSGVGVRMAVICLLKLASDAAVEIYTRG